MSLLEDVRAIAAQRTQRSSCTVGKALERMDAEDRADLTALLADDTILASCIAEALRGRGFGISDCTLQRHRRKACRCG